MMSDLGALKQAAQSLAQPLSDAQAQRLLAYRDLIVRWNRVYNLTSLRDPAQMLSHHILDSLAVVPALQRQLDTMNLPNPRLLDVGSGGGLPGVVLATMLEELNVRCVDAVGKKAAFVQQVSAELALRNLQGVHARVESLQAEKFHVIASRAVASLLDFVQLTRHLLDLSLASNESESMQKQAVWMALKAKAPTEEIKALPVDVEVFHVEHIEVPGLDAERCIVWMRLKKHPSL